jgi:hypothetical protein
MSTVQSLLDNLQFQVDVDADLYHLINLAVRKIAKRLYWHDADMVRSEMEIDFYKEFTYETDTLAFVDSDPDTITDSNDGFTEKTITASTISFVNGSPATIVDSAAGFVAAGFVAGQTIYTDDDENPNDYHIASVTTDTITLATGETLATKAAGDSVTSKSRPFVAGMQIANDESSNSSKIFIIETVEAGTLTLKSTDAVTAVTAGTSTILTVKNDRSALPTDFWGFCGDDPDDYPYVDGYTKVLRPLPNQRRALIENQSMGAIPNYFKIKGTNLHVSPPAGEDLTIKGDYFQRPTTLTATTDTIPFNEIFDDAICEAIATLYEKGLSSQVENTALLQKICFEAVDLIIPKYQQKSPTMAGGIDWDSFV